MTGAGSAGDPPGRGSRDPNRGATHGPERGATHGPDRGATSGWHAVVRYLRANPQVLVLLVICIVLGLGTFLAVLFGLLTAGSDQTTGEPSGAITGAHAMIAAVHTLIP